MIDQNLWCCERLMVDERLFIALNKRTDLVSRQAYT